MNGFTIFANAIEYIENNIYEEFRRTDVANYGYVSLSYSKMVLRYANIKG